MAKFIELTGENTSYMVNVETISFFKTDGPAGTLIWLVDDAEKAAFRIRESYEAVKRLI